MTTFNWDKPFRTKSGQKARLLGTIANDPYSKVVAVSLGEAETLERYTEAGEYFVDAGDSALNLVNLPESAFIPVWGQDGSVGPGSGGARGNFSDAASACRFGKPPIKVIEVVGDEVIVHNV